MKYYRRYPGDYLRDTARLTLTEHGAYTLLLDYYYSDERALPLDHDELYLMVRAMRAEDKRAVDRVLSLFFVRTAAGYVQKRVEHEIAVSRKARDNGAKGGRRSTVNGTDYGTDDGTGSLTGFETEPITGMATGYGTEQQTGDETEQVTGYGTGQATDEGGGSGHPPTTNHQPPTTNHQPPQKPSVSSGIPPPGSSSPPAAAPSGAQVWLAYRTAFVARYGQPPVRNAKINALAKQLVKRLGTDAPQVAGHYVRHNDRVYVRAAHALELLVRDAEKLHLDWRRGVTADEAAPRARQDLDALVRELQGQERAHA